MSATLMAENGHVQAPQKSPAKTRMQSEGSVQLTLKSAMSMVWLAASHPPLPVASPLELEVPTASAMPSNTTLPPHAAPTPAVATSRTESRATVRFIASSGGWEEFACLAGLPPCVRRGYEER